MMHTAPMKNIAVILAGGTGSRMGLDIPKQFIRLQDGRTVLETCVAAFQQNERIDEIAIVMHPDHKAEAKALLPSDLFPKVRYWIDGGKERWESSKNAVNALSVYYDECNLLIHDCARPFISQDLITRVCEALQAHEAVSVAVPVTDTLYAVTPDNQNVIADIPARALFRRAQTPQSFRLSVLQRAFSLALQHMDRPMTDDAGVVLHYLPEVPIHIVPGEESNKKITYKEDI